MMYEHLRNQQQHHHHVRLDMKKRNPNCEKKKQSPEEERLRVVDLSGKSLETLSTHSLNLAVICKLDLSNNNLQNIPESLTARLLNVIVLDVRSNQLTSLPNSIGCLSKLKNLNISGNLIEQLPITIEQCRLLEELNANFNKLTALPDTIGFELVNLKKLSVSFNKLAFLPYSLSHLTALKVLEARLNCLRSLPEDLENLINLEILDVSQNFQYLENLPYSVGLLISLTELDVSYNKIKSLPESVGCLRKIQKLRVEGNPLISPPMSVVEKGLPAVQEYLCDKMNSSDKSSKKRSWVNKLIKPRVFNGNMRKVRHDDRGGFTMREYRSIDGLASPRYKGMFSPIRFLSPSRLLHRSTSAK